MESLDADHSRIKLGIRLQELPKRLRRNILTTRNGKMRMPRPKLRLEARSKRGFLYALMNLKQMRMRLTDANPDDFRSTFSRKSSDASNR